MKTGGPAHGGTRRAHLARLDAALQLSAHVLRVDPAQTAGQLVGRLGRRVFAALPRDGRPRLVPLTPTLTPPFGPLRRTLAGNTTGVWRISLSADGGSALSIAPPHDPVIRWDLASGLPTHRLRLETVRAAGEEWRRWGLHVCDVSADAQRALVLVEPDLEVWDVVRGTRLCSLPAAGKMDALLRLSRNGRRVAVAAAGGDLRIWDVEEQAEIRGLTVPAALGGRRRAHPLALSADGGRLATATASHQVAVWDVDSGELVCVLAGHEAEIVDLALSADGGRLASISEDRTRRVWDAQSGAEIDRRRTGPLRWIEISGDGTHLVHANSARVGALCVDRVVEGRWRLRDLQWHIGVVNHAELSHDGRVAVSASKDFTMRVWDLEAPDEMVEVHGTSVRRTLLYAGGSRCFSYGYHDPKAWDTGSGAELPGVDADLSRAEVLALSDDGRLAVATVAHTSLQVVELPGGRVVSTLAGHTQAVYVAALTPDGSRALTASWDETAKVWDRDRGWACTHTFRHRAKKWVAMSRDGAIVATLEGDLHQALLVVRRVDEEAVVASLPLRDWRGGEEGAWLTPDGSGVLVDRRGDHEIVLIEVASGREVGRLPRLPPPHYRLSVSDDGRRLLTASGAELTVWTLPDLERVARFQLDDAVTDCALTADGSGVVAGDAGGVVHFLRVGD